MKTQIAVLPLPFQPNTVFTLPDEFGHDNGWIVAHTSVTMAQTSTLDPRPTPMLMVTLVREVEVEAQVNGAKEPGTILSFPRGSN